MYQLVEGRVLRICLKADNKLEYPMPCLVCVCQDCQMLTYWKMTRSVRVCVAVLAPSLGCSSQPNVENEGRDDR